MSGKRDGSVSRRRRDDGDDRARDHYEPDNEQSDDAAEGVGSLLDSALHRRTHLDAGSEPSEAAAAQRERTLLPTVSSPGANPLRARQKISLPERPEMIMLGIVLPRVVGR